MKDEDKTKEQLLEELVALRQQVIELESLQNRHQQAEPKQGEQRYRLLIEEAKDYAIFTIDLNGYIDSWNNGAKIVLGYQPAQIIGQPFARIFTPEDLREGEDQKELRTALDFGRAVDERWHVQLDGTRIWGSGIVTLLRDEAGNLLGFSKIMRDMTERKIVEVAQQRLTSTLENLVQERTAQLQQALDFEALLKRISDRVRDSLDESQILQTTVQELVLGLGLSGCNASQYNLANGTSTIHYEYVTNIPAYRRRTMRMADYPELYDQLLAGQYFQFCSIFPNPARGDVAILACPIMNGEGVLGDLWLSNAAECSFNELEIRLVQQVSNQCAIAIRQARLYQVATTQIEELEKLNQLKDSFLSTVSHELRTPLTNMKMALKMLKLAAPSADERVQLYLEVLQTECSREIDLINDLLDLQRLENASYASLSAEAIDLQDWLPGLINPFRVRTQQRQQTLQVNLPTEQPMLISYRAMLERILAELLNNACKYTSAKGEIVLNIGYKSAEAVTIFTISNSTEIPAEELLRIFDKFYRVARTDAWQQGGTGLGLALVQKLVEQMQGTILVESSKGWTTFTVELPNQSKA